MLFSSAGRAARGRSLHHAPCTFSSSSRLSHRTSPNQQHLPSRQRRYSSSKHSSPQKDDNRPITATGDAAAKAPTPKKRTASKVNRSRSKEALEKAGEVQSIESAAAVPSVPSTQHIHPQDVYLASFFSLHRPISVTTPIPTPSSNKSFSSIFTFKKAQQPTNSPADIIYTLSSAVQTLEKAAAQQQQQQQPPHQPQESSLTSELRHAIVQAQEAHADGVEQGQGPTMILLKTIEDLANNFRPFVPPPPPQPFSPAYPIHPTEHADPLPAGVVAEILEEESRRQSMRQPFLERMRIRQQQWEESRDETSRRIIWRAISVKRQRKLKMKKHKYKKLMKRTRNLRRRLDRL